MREIAISFIQSESFKSLLSIVVTAILTYFVTRKTDNKKQDINIRTLQLEKIYLPLYLYLDGRGVNEIDVKILCESMMMKKRKYFLYLSDTYLYHLECIKNINDNSSKKSQRIIKKCKIFIGYEYVKLKKELGYPYKSDFKNKYFIFYLVKLLFTFLNIILGVGFAIIIIFADVLFDNYGNLFGSLTYALSVIIMLDIIAGISYIYYQILLNEYFRSKW